MWDDTTDVQNECSIADGSVALPAQLEYSIVRGKPSLDFVIRMSTRSTTWESHCMLRGVDPTIPDPGAMTRKVTEEISMKAYLGDGNVQVNPLKYDHVSDFHDYIRKHPVGMNAQRIYYGDGAAVNLIRKLKKDKTKANFNSNSDIIAVPGPLHFTMAVVRMVFTKFGDDIIIPCLLELGHHNIDSISKNYIKSLDTINLITRAIFTYFHCTFPREVSQDPIRGVKAMIDLVENEKEMAPGRHVSPFEHYLLYFAIFIGAPLTYCEGNPNLSLPEHN